MEDRMRRSGRQTSRSASRRMVEEVFAGSTASRQSVRAGEDEEALRWAALEKLPTYDRLRKTVLKSFMEAPSQGRVKVVHKEIDVRKMDMNEKQEFIDRFFKVAEEDNEKFLTKFRDRIEKVGISLPTVEVRFEHLTVEADCFVGDRALPTLINTARNIGETALGCIGIRLAQKTKLTILKDVSGIIKPSRMTLLLGPPSSGKTTLLLALAGKLDPALKTRGEITYNGHMLDEFVPQKTSAYISQNDVHVGEMTVKETLDFSARCQGVGSRYELLTELARREREAGIFPEAEVDLFMKATAMEGVESSLITDYTLRILGLDVCRDTIVGDEMMRGISGGQKKRVTTGEMIVGPTKTLFMDEISTGLDSSTTFQIVKCLQQIVHLTEATIFMSLLQPAPETFDLFDDIVLLSEGQIVYQGPREHVVEFFESCGFKCPDRKGTADFLQEVTSRKDQEQYWADKHRPYSYIPVSEFARRFKRFHAGLRLEKRALGPLRQKQKPQRRPSIFIVAIITSTLFLRTQMHTRNEDDASTYIGALLFSMICNTFNGFAELSLAIQRLPVFYNRETFSSTLLGLILSQTFFSESLYPCSRPWFGRLQRITQSDSPHKRPCEFTHTDYMPSMPNLAAYINEHFLSPQILQAVDSHLRHPADGCGDIQADCRAVQNHDHCQHGRRPHSPPRVPYKIPDWWGWAYWCSPLSYAYNAITVNEMFAPRWMNQAASDGITPLGIAVLNNFNIFPDKNWYWIGFGALVGFTLLFNILFTFSLMYLNPLGKPQAIISKEQAREMEEELIGTNAPRLRPTKSKNDSSPEPFEMTMQRMSSGSSINRNDDLNLGVAPKRGMVLPFTPLSMSFDSVNYFVDMPPEMREQGVTEDRLQLLRDVTGAFRPGVLTALMGVSGAETFARISGYCEQTDIHSPQVTIHESLIYSAFLRLPKEVSKEQKTAFIDQVMDLVELESLKDAIVGIPGITGLSTEQRKRLTIAVELVANPSIIFMDEPTSGLDARAAAIVMRTVRNTVDTGRTVVCTIHQPSIDIFESFDELLLMKRGGQVIYAGPLGRHSQKIIDYFEAVPGVPRIKDKYNPATWMLEASSIATESRLGMDFADYYKTTELYERNKALVKELSTPAPGAHDLHFETEFSQSSWVQFKGSDSDLLTVIGAMYASVLFVGINNCSTVQPIVAIERTVFYRERAAGMYSALPYALSQLRMDIREILLVLFRHSLFSFLYFTYYGMMTVSITPNHQVAAIFAAAFYALFNLFSGFFVPRPKIPKWWVWYYWICPVAWTVYGLIIGQYGDVTTTITVAGNNGPTSPMIKTYIQDHFGMILTLKARLLQFWLVLQFLCFHVCLLHQESQFPDEVEVKVDI
ncbi:hypothetical protein SASPL_120527 [Salvia splendens]|uniref:ABC transporter domain-containing protein n=1 Tax=Salvia splendens TaxID=180675 RepID=A0A8X8XSN6_SALSN|nr:hypothetical protein SASPL_120527 [Salvia splendens]